RCLQLYGLYLAIAWLLHLTGVVSFHVGRNPVSLFALALAILAVVRTVERVRQGDRSARVFQLGLVAMTLIAMPDILDGSGLVSTEILMVPYAVLVLAISMLLVLVRQHEAARDEV